MKKPSMVGFKFCKALLAPLFKFCYRPIIINRENIPKDGPILIVGNHIHAFDQCSAIIATKRPIRYIAKKEYFDGTNSFFGKPTKIGCAISKWIVTLAGCIPVDRNIKDTDATNSAIQTLKNNEAIGLFPEGTRNKTDAFLQPFKFGAVSMAQKTDATLVPFGITGDYKFRSKNVIIRFGKPFKVGDMSLEEANKKLESEVTKLMKQNLEYQDKK